MRSLAFGRKAIAFQAISSPTCRARFNFSYAAVRDGIGVGLTNAGRSKPIMLSSRRLVFLMRRLPDFAGRIRICAREAIARFRRVH